MLTSIEIAKLLQKQRQEKVLAKGFDEAILGLGAKLKAQKNKHLTIKKA